jgi:hypothetical protein
MDTLDLRDLPPEEAFIFRFDGRNWLFVDPTGHETSIARIYLIANSDNQVVLFESQHGLDIGLLPEIPKSKVVTKCRSDLVAVELSHALDNGVTTLTFEVDDETKQLLSEMIKSCPSYLGRSVPFVPFQNLWLEHQLILKMEVRT